MRFCLEVLDPNEEMAVFVDTLIFDIFATLLLSMTWVFSFVASFLLKS
jgi:hypothetical protein